MEYTNQDVRRQDRLLDEARAFEIGVSPTFTTNVTLRLYFYRNIHKLNL